MSRIFRRLASTASGPSASEAAKEILQRYGNKPVSVREQLLDANHVRLLSTTFGRQNVHEKASLDADGAPVEGTPLPPGYHFIYFTPTFQEQSLGIDGTDKTLNPLSPWTRRMWAGGSMEWTQDPKRILRIGQKVKETTQITSAEEKKMKSGDSMVLAGLEKTFENEHGVALVDKRLVRLSVYSQSHFNVIWKLTFHATRNWVFQKEMTAKKEPPPKPEEKPLPEGKPCQNPPPTWLTSASQALFLATFAQQTSHYSASLL